MQNVFTEFSYYAMSGSNPNNWWSWAQEYRAPLSDAIISEYQLVPLYIADTSAGGADSGEHTLLDDISKYSAFVVQGVYSGNPSSTNNTTFFYPTSLAIQTIYNNSTQTPFYAGVNGSRSSTYLLKLRFSSTTTIIINRVGGSSGVRMYGVR